nr:uncharacterized protein LOC117854138 [Setaria viridis]
MEPPQILSAMASPSPDGRSLFLFPIQIEDRLRPLQLHLRLYASDNRKITASPLPAVPLGPIMRTRPIAAASDLWAPCFSDHVGPPLSSTLTMKRLDKDAGRWVEVDAKNKPHVTSPPPGEFVGRVLHGYVVIGHVILLSMQPSHVFFTFDCSTCTWAEVVTTETEKNRYIPIHERAVYVEEDDTIYFLSSAVVYAYKLCQDDQGQYRMAPPTLVDCICPFDDEGYGFLTHLGNRLMCAVWIGVSLRCSCDTRHVLITVFRVTGSMSNQGHFFPKGIKILHSTCRRLDISPSTPITSNGEFCFLQEYEVFNLDTSMPLEAMEAATSLNVAEPSVMLGCCREFRNETPLRTAVMLEGSPILARKALYIVCQVASHSTVYKVFIADGRLECHGKILRPRCIMNTFSSGDEYGMMKKPLPWHFVCCSKNIYAYGRSGDELYTCNLHSGALSCIPLKRPVQVSIALVLQVGSRIIAIGDTICDVYCFGSNQEWKHIRTHGTFNLKREVNLSGYAVLSDDIFIVSDADRSCLLLLDLLTREWSYIRIFSEFSRSPHSWVEVVSGWPSESGFLNGRSVFIEGFIYSCADGGIAAYEIIKQGDSYYLGDHVYMKLQWCKFWEARRMCLDYVGKDTVSGAIVLCVVQGGNYFSRSGPLCSQPVCITTIKVKIERTTGGKLRPALDHVDVGTCFLEQKEVIWTSNCFATVPF